MMIQTTTYTNSSGASFDIEVDRAVVPTGSDYWGYRFRVRKQPDGFQHCFSGLILKTTVPTQEAADAFVIGPPLDFLRHDLLNSFDGESTPLYWPSLTSGWVVF